MIIHEVSPRNSIILQLVCAAKQPQSVLLHIILFFNELEEPYYAHMAFINIIYEE